MSLTIDLHTHSTASDGALPPAELAAYLAERGVQAWALTDHDCIEGLAEAQQASQGLGLDFYNGVELSLCWQNLAVHVVGLGFNADCPALAEQLDQQSQRRQQRARAMAERLAAAGIAGIYQRACELAGNDRAIGRPHLARALVADGYCKQESEAFRRYLGQGKRAHVGIEWPTLEQGIEWLHQAGGKAVLAHPHRYGLSAGKLRRLLNAFVEAGGDAMEVVCGNLPADRIRHLGSLAQKRKLLASVGSDLHSPEQRWLRPGQLSVLPEGCQAIWPHLNLA